MGNFNKTKFELINIIKQNADRHSNMGDYK